MHVALAAVVSRGSPASGPTVARQTCLVRREDWLGKPPPFERDRALAELARRYVRAFGPATDRDFAYWSGLPLRDVRAGLSSISSEIEEVRVGEEDDAGDARRATAAAAQGPGADARQLRHLPARLEGPGSSRSTGEHAVHVKEGGGGWIRPVIVEDGIVVGGWRSSRRGGRLEISLNLPKRERERLGSKIDAEIADIARFEGIEATIL